MSRETILDTEVAKVMLNQSFAAAINFHKVDL